MNMAIRTSLVLFVCLASLAEALQFKGISIASEQKKSIDKDTVSHGFDLAELLGGTTDASLESWTNVLHKLGHGQGIKAEDLSQAMEATSSSTYTDPSIQEKLSDQISQERLANLTKSPEKLMKTVQQSPMLQRLAKENPAIAQIINNSAALQEIFSPEVLQQVSSGHVSGSSMQRILGTAGVSTLPEGLKVKQIKAGDGKTFPEDGDEVVLQYKGLLTDGTVFGNGLFSFHIGSGEAIQGWDIAVRHMSLGERAVLEVPSDLAYGDEGKGPIPPDAKLVFDASLRKIN